MDRGREVGIIFADIVGSSRMYELLGDDRALAVVTGCFDILSDVVALHRGTVVKTIGDALMAAFEAPADTLSAAMDMRRRVGALPPVPDIAVTLRPRLRVGAHFGPAVPDNGDWFGDTVNIAARLSDLASASQVLTTGDLLDRLPPGLRALATVFAEIEVKGRETPVRIARVADDDDAAQSTVVGFLRTPAPTAAEGAATLTFGARRWTLSGQTRRLVCGREADADITLTGSLASRRHATIELRRDKVVLMDHSTNGTWLMQDGQRPIRLMREEYGLTGRGSIVFGDPAAADAQSVGFEIG